MTRPPAMTRSKTWSAAGGGAWVPATAGGVDGPDVLVALPAPLETAAFLGVGSLLRASAFAAPKPNARSSFRRSGDAGPVVTVIGLAGGCSGRGARGDRHARRARRPHPGRGPTARRTRPAGSRSAGRPP